MTDEEKSAGKSAPGLPFALRDDPRRGRGPLPDAPNAGRPKSAVRALAQEAADKILPELVAIALNAEERTADRIRAAEVVGRWAGVEKLESWQAHEGEGAEAYGFVVFPPLNPRPSMEEP